MEINNTNQEKNIWVMTPKDAYWPSLLRHINDPPKRLFIRGTWPPRFADGTAVNEQTKFLCIVGARRHSVYGREACEALIAGLSGYNICIVSGLALGIDAVAHKAALEARIPTVAFPGSGLEEKVLYPPRNMRLAKQILQSGGALLSELDTDTVAAPWCFPQRNRLMAGISHATLVIEAKCPSGTLITSKLARGYNRDVFALPGDIFSALSDGPHMLIADGAALIRKSTDILHQLGIKPREEIEDENKEESADDIGRQSQLFEVIHGKTENEKMIYKIIIDAGSKISKDDLIRTCINTEQQKIITVSEILITLTSMEIGNLIAEKNGIIYIVRRKI